MNGFYELIGMIAAVTAVITAMITFMIAGGRWISRKLKENTAHLEARLDQNIARLDQNIARLDKRMEYLEESHRDLGKRLDATNLRIDATLQILTEEIRSRKSA
jgi:predicted transcriptional regulator